MESGNMATVNSKMTALADEIRELSGSTSKKSLEAMTTDVSTANTEIAEQAELLEQIVTALENKTAGGGGVELPELTNPASTSDILNGKEAIDGDGNVITGTIATKTSPNLTASGATVTVPAGYYASNASKSVGTATQATPSISVDANGKITASATQSAGYVSAGTKTGTKQLTTQTAKTITPTTSSQTAVAKNVYTTGVVTVGAIPSNYEDVGTETIEYTSLNAELEAVINSLPDAGSGSGGSSGGSSTAGEWIPVSSLPSTYLVPGAGVESQYYYEVPTNCRAVVILCGVSYGIIYKYSDDDVFNGTVTIAGVTVTDADNTGTILSIYGLNDYLSSTYLLPIYTQSFMP
jgi:hypothetical protein